MRTVCTCGLSIAISLVALLASAQAVDIEVPSQDPSEPALRLSQPEADALVQVVSRAIAADSRLTTFSRSERSRLRTRWEPRLRATSMGLHCGGYYLQHHRGELRFSTTLEVRRGARFMVEIRVSRSAHRFRVREINRVIAHRRRGP